MLKLQTPNGDNRVLLHSCCAPCSSAIIECMLATSAPPCSTATPTSIRRKNTRYARTKPYALYNQKNSISSMPTTTTSTGSVPCTDWKTSPNAAPAAWNASPCD